MRCCALCSCPVYCTATLPFCGAVLGGGTGSGNIVSKKTSAVCSSDNDQTQPAGKERPEIRPFRFFFRLKPEEVSEIDYKVLLKHPERYTLDVVRKKSHQGGTVSPLTHKKGPVSKDPASSALRTNALHLSGSDGVVVAATSSRMDSVASLGVSSEMDIDRSPAVSTAAAGTMASGSTDVPSLPNKVQREEEEGSEDDEDEDEQEEEDDDEEEPADDMEGREQEDSDSQGSQENSERESGPPHKRRSFNKEDEYDIGDDFIDDTDQVRTACECVLGMSVRMCVCVRVCVCVCVCVFVSVCFEPVCAKADVSCFFLACVIESVCVMSVPPSPSLCFVSNRCARFSRQKIDLGAPPEMETVLPGFFASTADLAVQKRYVVAFVHIFFVCVGVFASCVSAFVHVCVLSTFLSLPSMYCVRILCPCPIIFTLCCSGSQKQARLKSGKIASQTSQKTVTTQVVFLSCSLSSVSPSFCLFLPTYLPT